GVSVVRVAAAAMFICFVVSNFTAGRPLKPFAWYVGRAPPEAEASWPLLLMSVHWSNGVPVACWIDSAEKRADRPSIPVIRSALAAECAPNASHAAKQQRTLCFLMIGSFGKNGTNCSYNDSRRRLPRRQ